MKRSVIQNPEKVMANIDSMQMGIDNGGELQPGAVCFANASRFVEANFSEPLTTYATGWRDPNNIEQTLEFVAPAVATAHRFEFSQANNAEEFLTETDDVRGIGAEFKRVEFSASKVNSKTLNKGLIIRVDEDNVIDTPNWREQYTGRLMRRLLRNELRRAISLLSAAAANTAKTWDANADPDQDLLDANNAFGDLVGFNANRGLFGLGSWSKRRASYAAQNNSRGYAGLAANQATVADTAQLDEILVSKERYQSSRTAKSRVTVNSTGGQIVLVFMAEAGQTPEDPSSIKRFTSNTAGGTQFRVYEQRISAKLIDISVEHYSNIIVTSTLGIQQLTVS